MVLAPEHSCMALVHLVLSVLQTAYLKFGYRRLVGMHAVVIDAVTQSLKFDGS